MRGARLLWFLCVLVSGAARADSLQHEFLLLPSVQVVGTFDRHAPVTQITDEVLQADALFSVQNGPFKLFGEYLVSDHEGDLERFQLGWQLSDDAVLWIGRYHQPTSVWNHEHHHGQYLQTSVSRPAIDEWEDLGGVLPQHFTGALFESERSVGSDWRLRTALGGGVTPQITSEGLEPYDLVHPDGNRHQLGFQARASIHPDEFTETGAGLLAAADAMPMVGKRTSAQMGFDHVELRLFGAFGTYAGTNWKISATLYSAHADLYYLNAPAASDDFAVGYLQVEGRLRHELTVFLREEESAGTGNSQYLRLFDEFAKSRHVGGLRWDFFDRQALTLQLSNSHTLNGYFSDVRLQWSGALF